MVKTCRKWNHQHFFLNVKVYTRIKTILVQKNWEKWYNGLYSKKTSKIFYLFLIKDQVKKSSQKQILCKATFFWKDKKGRETS